MSRSHKSTAVIGAGISGLACAQALLAQGHRVDLFEKSRGPAGRMSTRRGEDVLSPWQCDHGAQYFTAQDPLFRAEVARWVAAGVAAPWSARIMSLDANGWSGTSATHERFVGTPRMTAPAAWALRQLGDSASFYAQHTVQRVERLPEGWAITTTEHGLSEARYEALVLAIPAPQAHALLATVSSAAADVAASVRMRGSWALMLRFETCVELPFDGAFINTGPLRWIARDSSKPGRIGPETWLLHASAQWSEAHLENDPAEVSRALMGAFIALGGPAPSATSTHRWRYADTASGSASVPMGCWWSEKEQLGLCGDWLNGGRVQGAWLSGHQLALEICG